MRVFFIRGCFAIALLAVGLTALASPPVWGGEVDATPAAGPGARERIAEIQRRIQGAVVYPEFARRHRITGVSHVRFEVGDAGRALNIEIARSSGHSTLDRAARRAVVDASGLPWVYGRLEVPVRFVIDRES